MKKILGLTTLLLCLLGTQSAFADVALSEPNNALEVRISCADMGNAGVSVSVLKSDAPEEEPAFVYQTKGTKDGAYLVNMQLSSNLSGIYTVSVFDIAKKSNTQKTFFLSDADTYRTKIGELNLLKNEEATVILEYIEQNKNELEFANPLYEATNKTKTAILLGEQLKKGLFSETDREQNRGIYKNLLAINGLRDEKISDLDELALYAQLMYEGELKAWYQGLKSATVKNEIFAMVNGKAFADIGALEDALIEAFVLKKVRHNDGWGEAKNIIKQFEKKVGITANDYSDTAFSAVSGNSYASYSELIEALDKKNGSSPAIKQPNKGSGGGGGGGGGVPSVSIPAGKVPTQNVTPIQKSIFTDLEGVLWASEHIEKLYELKIISGNGDGTFLPNNNVTREEFVKMIVVAFNMYNENAEAEFTDVSDDAWYYRYVASAVESGLVSGIGENLFGVGNKISRQDMAVIAYRAAKKAGKTFKEGQEIAFADGDLISDYAIEGVTTLSKSGIINGMDGSFCPFENSTRAQAAVVISKLRDLN